MKINKIIFLSVLGLLISISACSAAWSIDNDYLNSNTGSGSGTAYEPVVTPAAGAYTSSQSVSLSASGATNIRYTTDGTTPSCTSGTVFGSAIIVNSNQTIKAISCYADNGGVTSASNVSSHAYTFSCPTVSNAATYNAYPTCGPATCNSGYTKSGSTCVADQSGGGGGGGGGGGSVIYCATVSYTAWASSCVGNFQYRTIVSQSPANCSLTTPQQLDAQRACQITSTDNNGSGSSTGTTTPGTSGSGDVVLQNILTEAQILNTNIKENLLVHLSTGANVLSEQAGLTKYGVILGLDKSISATEKMTIDYFIVYGTLSTKRLGAGERAAVVNSYFRAYSKLPNSEAEWSDLLKIASGRWPVERNSKIEEQAKLEFKKVYEREANLKNNIDENAIMVISYGLLPLQRNLNSEKVAIKTFRWVYSHDPVNALAWNIVRAIAYSGAKR